jgi:endonuclease YncB( thermonuclease family)
MKPPIGNRSKQNMSRLAYAKQATTDCPKRDRYGRQRRTLYAGGRT